MWSWCIVSVTEDGVSLAESGVLVVRKKSFWAEQRLSRCIHCMALRYAIAPSPYLRRRNSLVCPYLGKIRRSQQGGPLAAHGVIR